MAVPPKIRSLLDAPEHLLATHDRLRASGFPVVSVINGPSSLEARLWLCVWAFARERAVFTAPTPDPEVVLAAYLARMPTSQSGFGSATGPSPGPILLIPGDSGEALAAAVAISRQAPALAVAIVCGIAGVVETLVKPSVPAELVIAALQGLVPIDDTSRQVSHTVAKARDMQPFLRGPCEGLLYYMLEARPETRGRFRPNLRLGGADGSATYEVDLACPDARLIVEIDGPEHEGSNRKRMDARKQRALEEQGYRLSRFGNDEVRENPVQVWRHIATALTSAPISRNYA